MIVRPYRNAVLPTRVRVHKGHALPRHFQVRQILQEMVTTGRWKSGEKIPAETDIAQALGVSKMTVNKAILSLTAEGVLYREVGRGTFISGSGSADAGRGAADAAAAKTVIEVITTQPTELVSDDEYVCALLLAMRYCVNPMDVQIFLRHVRGPEYLARWRNRRSDGWILIAPRQEDVPGLHDLAAARASAVVVGASWEEVDLPSVDSDNIGGARLAVEHLVSLGHRKIGLLYGDTGQRNTRHRVDGFEQAMQSCGLRARPEWMLDVESSWGISSAARARIHALMQGQDAPTAFFAAGPIIACSLLQMASEAGIPVPGRLSIVGFDDPRAVVQSSPVLTTIRQPLEEMGSLGILRLQQRIEGVPEAAEPLRQVLPCLLLARDSTAPPASGRAVGEV